MKKKRLLAICLILITIMLYGCRSDNTSSNPIQEITIPEILISKDSVSTSQIKKDIIAREEVQTCFTASFTEADTFELDHYELIKEQINEEDKEDLVYATVTVKNTYFEVVLNVKCVYNYYDKGGWILDEFYIESTEQVTPIAAPSKNLVADYITDGSVVNDRYTGKILCSYQMQNYQLESGTLAFKEWMLDETGHANLLTSYQSKVLSVEGHYEVIFEENDWRIVNEDDRVIMQIDSYTSDYSNATGSFTLEGELHSFDPITYYGDLNIHEISNGQANYDLSFWMAENIKLNVRDGKNVSARFNDLTGTIHIGRYLSGDNMYLRYDCENDCWIEGAYSRFVR